ncbi:hypothetical protein OfM1_18420 [Lactovum odontotermitis]
MKQLRFEFLRIFSGRKNQLLYLLLTFLVIVLAIYSSNLKNSNDILALKEHVNQSLQLSKQNLADYSGDLTVPEDIIKSTKTDYGLLEKQKNALDENDINSYYKLEYKLNESRIQSGVAGTDNAGNSLVDDNKYIETVIDRGLDFETFAGTQLHAFGLMNEIYFPLVLSSLAFIIYVLIGGVSVSSDYESRMNRFYKCKIFTSKQYILDTFLANSVILSVWYVLAALIYLVIVGLTQRFGSPNYPSGFAGISLLENWKVGLFSLLWGILVIIFLNSLGVFLSVLLKKTSIVVGIIAVLILGYQMIKNQPFLQPIRKFIPMSYFEPIPLLRKEVYLFSSPVVFGAVFLLLLTILFLSSSVFIQKQYKIRKV